MILTLLFKLFVFLIKLVLSLIPRFDPPSWVSDVGSAASTVAGALAGTSSWVPWSSLFVALAVIMGCYVAAAAIRIARIVASFLTLGGGA